jgi:hypothetical protein
VPEVQNMLNAPTWGTRSFQRKKYIERDNTLESTMKYDWKTPAKKAILGPLSNSPNEIAAKEALHDQVYSLVQGVQEYRPQFQQIIDGQIPEGMTLPLGVTIQDLQGLGTVDEAIAYIGASALDQAKIPSHLRNQVARQLGKETDLPIYRQLVNARGKIHFAAERTLLNPYVLHATQKAIGLGLWATNGVAIGQQY